MSGSPFDEKKKYDIGEQINKRWRELVSRINIDAIRPERMDDDYADYPYLYVEFERYGDDVDIVDWTVDYPDYWRGSQYLVGMFPLHPDVTKEEMMNFDMAEETQYYEQEEWVDDE